MRADTEVVETVVKADTEVVEIETSPFLMIEDKNDQAGVTQLRKVEMAAAKNRVTGGNQVGDLMGEEISSNARLNGQKINHQTPVSQKEVRAIKETGAQPNGMISPLTNRVL